MSSLTKLVVDEFISTIHIDAINTFKTVHKFLTKIHTNTNGRTIQRLYN